MDGFFGIVGTLAAALFGGCLGIYIEKKKTSDSKESNLRNLLIEKYGLLHQLIHEIQTTIGFITVRAASPINKKSPVELTQLSKKLPIRKTMMVAQFYAPNEINTDILEMTRNFNELLKEINDLNISEKDRDQTEVIRITNKIKYILEAINSKLVPIARDIIFNRNLPENN